MSIKQIGSAEAKYLAATDILIGDMSNVNYEFLLYDRPIILLANEWVRSNFPDIGIKTDLEGLERAIKRSISFPHEHVQQRKAWLHKTMYKPNGSTSKRFIDIMLQKSGIRSPRIVFIHGNDSVRKTNLDPLVAEAERRGIPSSYLPAAPHHLDEIRNCIFVGAHFRDLMNIVGGYKVHIDHDLKGKGTSVIGPAIEDYKHHDYFPMIDLHITPGEEGDKRTKRVLGPNAERTVIGGYPKSDDLLRLNTPETRSAVFAELGFDESKLLVTYAPVVPHSIRKPGASLSPQLLPTLRQVSRRSEHNFLIKMKYTEESFIRRLMKRVGQVVSQVRLAT